MLEGLGEAEAEEMLDCKKPERVSDGVAEGEVTSEDGGVGVTLFWGFTDGTGVGRETAGGVADGGCGKTEGGSGIELLGTCKT